MPETYRLPVRFTEQERARYAAWGIKKAKTLMPFFILSLLIDVLTLVVTFSMLFGLFPLSEASFFLRHQTEAVAAFQNILFVALNMLILRPMDILCDKLLKRPKDPRVLQLQPSPDGVQYQLLQKKTVLCSGLFSWADWDQVIVPAANQIWIEKECLTIGANTIQTIYPTDKQHPWMDRPDPKLFGPCELKTIQKNMDGYLASLEEKKREAEWLRQNRHTLEH